MSAEHHICHRCGTIWSCKCTLDEALEAEQFITGAIRYRRTLEIKLARFKEKVDRKLREWRIDNQDRNDNP